jgi:hypothetical protein
MSAVVTLIARKPALVNFSTRRVGGIRFFKLGRFTLAFSVSREYRAL